MGTKTVTVLALRACQKLCKSVDVKNTIFILNLFKKYNPWGEGTV